jgi:hypothetical protein
MNTPLGPNLKDLETIHSLAWRVTAAASVGVREGTVHGRVASRGHGTPPVSTLGRARLTPWNAPNGRSLQPPTKHRNRAPQSEPSGFSVWHGASLRLAARRAQRSAK